MTACYVQLGLHLTNVLIAPWLVGTAKKRAFADL